MQTTALAVPATAIACARVEAEDIGELVAAPVALMRSSLQLQRHLHVCQMLRSLDELCELDCSMSRNIYVQEAHWWQAVLSVRTTDMELQPVNCNEVLRQIGSKAS